MTPYKPNPELAGPLYGKDPWPLKFHSHSFGAVCFNTLACSINYCGCEFGTRKMGDDGESCDVPSGTPPVENWRERWMGSHGVVPDRGRTFTSPVEIEWTSMDRLQHVASIDLDEIFKDRLVLHRVSRDEVKAGWLDAKSISPVSPHLLVEVNDRTVNIYMRAIVATEAEQMPGNSHSHIRNDLILAWTHTY